MEVEAEDKPMQVQMPYYYTPTYYNTQHLAYAHQPFAYNYHHAVSLK
jgi:hypothetical protein